MTMKFLTLLLVILCLLCTLFFSLCIQGVLAGTEGGLCPDRQVTIVDGVSFPTAIIPCDYDCKTNHNSSQGDCTTDGNYNCNCSGIADQTQTSPTVLTPINGNCTYFNNGFNITQVCQCASNNPLFINGYIAVCEGDCKCNHGAFDGLCNFEHHQCNCDYDFPNGTHWTNGSDSATPTCPVQGFFNVTQAIVNFLSLIPLFGR